MAIEAVPERRRVPLWGRSARLWSPAQPFCLALGVTAVAAGILGLLRSGLALDHLTRGAHSFAGFSYNPLLAVTAIGFGVLTLVSSRHAVSGRALMTLLGASTLGLGIVLRAGWWGTRPGRWLASNTADAWLLIGVGGILLLAAMVMPVLVLRDRDDERGRSLEAPAPRAALGADEAQERVPTATPPRTSRATSGRAATKRASSARVTEKATAVRKTSSRRAKKKTPTRASSTTRSRAAPAPKRANGSAGNAARTAHGRAVKQATTRPARRQSSSSNGARSPRKHR